MANPVVYPYSTWQPDSYSADSNHPITLVDLMGAGSANDNAGWMRKVESQMRFNTSANGQWEQWLGINTPYSPSPNAPVYVSSTQFTLTGDWTTASAGYYPAIAIVGRRVKAYTTSNPAPVGVTGTITAATVAGGITTVTVSWDSATIDSSISEVQFGIPAPGGAAPLTGAQTFYGVATETSSNVYTVTVTTPSGVSPTSLGSLQGQIIMVGFSNGNSGPTTLNVNGFGAENVVIDGGNALAGGEIEAAQWIPFTWTSGAWQILSPASAMVNGVFIGLSGPPSAGYIPIASSSVLANWGPQNVTFPIQRAYKSTIQSVVSSTVLVNDTALFIPIQANEVWQVQGVLLLTENGGSLKGTFTSPSGSTMYWQYFSGEGLPFSSGAVQTFVSGLSGATAIILGIQITVINGSTGGNMQFEFAQVTSNAAASSVLPGSNLVGYRMSP